MVELDDIAPLVVSKNGHVEGGGDLQKAFRLATFGPVEKYARGGIGGYPSRMSASGNRSYDGGGLYDELGRTGLRHWGGFVFEEWLRELQTGRRAAEVFREMADQDPVIGAILYVIEMLVRRVDWWMEPASDKPQDKENADFMWGALNDTYHSFEDMIAEILSFLQYGWSYFEIVYKRRAGPHPNNPKLNSKFSDGKIGVRKLGVRSQDSLWKWVFDDDGELVGLIQNPPPDYTIRFVPYDKALLFRTKVVKDNPEGRSILRTAYRPWYFLKNMQNIEGIGVERDLAGLPMLKAPPGVDIWNTNDPVMVGVAAAAQNLLSSIRRDEQEGILIPDGWEFGLVSTGGRRQFDTNALITRYEQRIATSVLADVILLGMDKVGSYALASEKVALLGYSIGAYLDTIANVINDRLTPKLLALNGQKGMTDYPQLCHGAIETLDLETLGTFLTGMASAATAGMFDGEDGLDLRASLQKRAGLPIPVNPIPGVGGMGDPNQDNTGAADKPAANGKPKAQAAPPADAKPKPKDVKDQSRMAKPVNT